MAELELSIMSRGPTTANDLKPLLEEFEAENHVRVRLRVMQWDSAWADLLKVALYRHGPDISEIGSTWLGSFVGMHALQPFSDEEVEAIGGPAAFTLSTWESGAVARHPLERALRWAIPWWADTRLLYYRRDILAQAGIDEDTAFTSFAQLEQTLERLVQARVPVPWVIPTHESRMTIHNVASWIWGAGGHLVSGDGRRTLFNWARARSGIQAYFELARYLTGPARDLDDTQSDALFNVGTAAVTISGPWLVRFASSQVLANMGMTLVPGTPFVGGSHLVCWRHAVYGNESIDLIRFLTSEHVQAAFGQRAGLLPTRPDVLRNPPFADDPLYQTVAEGLEKGRSFRPIPLWGLVEEKMSEALSDLWAQVLADPDLDLEQAVADCLGPLAQRLDITLGSRRW
jgi:multiple sugar transport system substrate-binding protein